MISAWAGLTVGLIVIKVTFITNATLTLLCGMASSIFAAYMGKKLNLLVRSCGTSFFGSYLIIKGMNAYLGGLSGGLFTGHETFVPANLTYQFYLYFVAFVSIAIYGSYFQMKTMKSKSDDDYSYNQDLSYSCC